MTSAEPKGRGLKWKALAKNRILISGVEARSADTRDQWTRLTREKSEQKTEYGYKRRCGGKDRRGVQEKRTAAGATQTREVNDAARHEKSERKN